MNKTKELNAGIAFICLQFLREEGSITAENMQTLNVLAEKVESLPIYVESTSNEDVVQQCINLIEEYLKEQGV